MSEPATANAPAIMPAAGSSGGGTGAQCPAPAADQAVEPMADPDDPCPDLRVLTREQLRCVVDELKAKSHLRGSETIRLAMAVGRLGELEGGAGVPREIRSSQGPASAAAAATGGQGKPPRVKVETVVRRVKETAGPKAIDDFEVWFAEEFRDFNVVSKRTFRGFAEGVRLGLITPRTVVSAHKAAKNPGLDRPPAVFVQLVLQGSPEFDRQRKERKRARRDAAVGDGARSGLPRGDR